MIRRVTIADREHRALELHKGSPLDRALRGVTLATSTDRARAERSRLTWAAERDQPGGPFRLSPLGVLNGLFGLVVWVEDACPRRQCRGRVPHSTVVHWLGWVRR